MKIAVVTFENKDTITTEITGTDEEIRKYYSIGRSFNLGQADHDLMTRVSTVEIREQAHPVTRPCRGYDITWHGLDYQCLNCGATAAHSWNIKHAQQPGT